MFKCNHCKKTFEYPKKVMESRGEFWGAPAYEDMYYCPYCGDDDFDLYNEDEDYDNSED